MKIFDDIPKVWKRAYLLLCFWYAINYSVGTFLQWNDTPYTYIFWNALYLLEAHCILMIVIFFYCNWLFRYNIYVQVAGHIVGVIIYFVLIGSLSYYHEDYLEGFIYYEHWKAHLIQLLKWEGLHFHDQYIITVGVYYVIRYFQGVQKQEEEKSALNLKNREMQISLLKSQINPHFLFNTLNSINTLIGSSKEQARRVITQLSDIFRYALDSHGDQMVRLINELDFIDNYIRIQQVRFGDRLKFVKQVDFSCLGVRIPPMILQPLVENSVKYGIAPKDEGGTIVLTVKRFNTMIFFEVKDDGLGSNAKKVMDGSSSGVGLKNTDQRLKSIFGHGAGLRIRSNEWGYSVSFFIPYEEETTHAPQEVREVMRTRAG
ncbi:MAG TPA: histidine kinase [Chryseosolibacter sp.]|nr:histidine kinase [Chryseosolibacter sp.]